MIDFETTNGWLERWKTCNAIQLKKQHGDDFGAERRAEEKEGEIEHRARTVKSTGRAKKSNPLGKIRYLWNCSKFFRHI